MSYQVGNYYSNLAPVAFEDEPLAPVPGWGMNPLLAGPARVGVGASDGDELPTSVYLRAQVLNGKITGGLVLGLSALDSWNPFYADVNSSYASWQKGEIATSNPIWLSHKAAVDSWEAKVKAAESGKPVVPPSGPWSPSVPAPPQTGGGVVVSPTPLPTTPTPAAATPAKWEKYLVPGAVAAAALAGLYLWSATKSRKGGYVKNHPYDIRSPKPWRPVGDGMFATKYEVVRVRDRNLVGELKAVREGNHFWVSGGRDLKFLEPVVAKTIREQHPGAVVRLVGEREGDPLYRQSEF